MRRKNSKCSLASRWLLESSLSPAVALVVNLFWVFVVYTLARLVFIADIWSLFSGHLQAADMPMLLLGGLRFDASAIAYTNALYMLMLLFPLFYKETRGYHTACKWAFVVINVAALLINLADTTYFPYGKQRVTTAVFNEFGNETNIGRIVLHETVRHWYFVLLVIAVAFGLWKLYVTPRLWVKNLQSVRQRVRYTVVLLLSLGAAIGLSVAWMRGGFTNDRPIALNNANQYVRNPLLSGAVLNTPFSLLRTVGKNVYSVTNYFPQEELAARFTPIHQPAAAASARRKNVVVLIVESFGREYIGAFNRWLEGGNYKGYTPCVDSLIAKSLVYEHSFCNGYRSIDAMPSILAGIPMIKEHFFLTPATMNEYTGAGAIFSQMGYETAFFHGADRKSMGFQAFANKIGYQHYYGREDYCEDSRFGGEADYDGTWGIWDEPFLQYYCTKIGEMREPFLATVFTLSSHHPFNLPEKYRGVFAEGPLEIHKCISYTDMAIGKFFASARRQPWYDSTLFFIFSDHTSRSNHEEYSSNIGMFSSPIIIYDPSGEIKPGVSKKVAQQIDFLPTVLNYLGCDLPYLSFGCDLFNTPSEETYALSYTNGVYQYVKYGYVLQFDGEKSRALYSLEDRAMRTNLLGRVAEQQRMEEELKAIIQQYMYRMVHNELLP